VAIDRAARPLVAWRSDRLTLALFTIAGVIGVLKGLDPHLTELRQFYWYLTYHDGLIRRALLGTLFHPLLRFGDVASLAPVIIAAHLTVIATIVATIVVLYDHAISSEQARDSRIALICSYLCLMCSPWLSTLAHDVGYVDVYIGALVAGSVALVLSRHYVAAGVLASVGPFVHEEFIFAWLPVLVLVGWSIAMTHSNVPRKLAAVALPLMAMAIVVGLHDHEAELTAVRELPVSDLTKQGLAAYAFGQTFGSSFDHMRRLEYPGHIGNAVTALAYLAAPAAVIWLVAPLCYWQRWRRPFLTLFVGAVAVVSPLMLLAFAWDLSRIAVWSNLAAAVVVLALGSEAVLDP
jgi:hypothetical protein